MKNQNALESGSELAVSGSADQGNDLRLWPGVVIVLLMWLGRFGLPVIVPAAVPFGMIGVLVGGLAMLIWWAFFSRASRAERWSALLLMIIAMGVTFPLLHESVSTAMMGLMFPIYAFPVLCLFFVGWAVMSRGLSDKARRLTMVLAIVASTGAWTFVRTDGMTGYASQDFTWRWSETHEQRLLAGDVDNTVVSPADVVDETNGIEWTGFRGPNRDSVVRGAGISSDWSVSPPTELWRRSIGPGCSSFAVRGHLLYTQEQRGEEEVVACYDAATGAPVWKHRDSARFWESHAGAGPRATPTLYRDRVFAFGATGILNALNAKDGAVIWSRNAAEDLDAEIPGWGFSSSPLVRDGVVIIAAAGKLAGYDLETGESRWTASDGGGGYSSPHLLTLDGVAQVLLMSTDGAISVDPMSGTALWRYAWPSSSRIVQPALTADGEILMSEGESRGMRRVAVAREGNGWRIEERWTTNGLKPNFNDFVIHGDHAYGVDGGILACIDIRDGSRQWKGGRYGHGQLILLADQDLLLVVSERGQLALVDAVPDGYRERSKYPAIEGKTWNHPALAGDVLLVRNSREMAAFRLAR